MDEFTYAKAGVDIEKENRVIKKLKGIIGSDDRILYEGMQIVMSTDGVGSKIIVANEMKKWDTIGIDCIAMNVNDLLCIGAKPLAFVDYLAMEKMDESIAEQIAIGLQRGAEQAGVKIVGGETATLPEIINGLDLAGTAVGIVEKKIPSDLKEGDILIGLISNGLHSNGFTLARKVFKENGYSFSDEIDGIGVIGEELLKPTRIYVKEIVELWEKIEVKGIAHITGSGVYKIMRMISSQFKFVIDDPFIPHKIFQVIKNLGNISDYEMYKTFNMGMGIVVAVDRKDVDDALQMLNKHVEAKTVGRIEKGKGVIIPSMNLKYE
ncbi:MAG: phosphoribosylformylglycinamidine cyclo-ligase [Thermoplasmata archaeon]|nr:phosphoribosylformylglycinamidine cyclo-ligase [Thermoplasmata archaeon]